MMAELFGRVTGDIQVRATRPEEAAQAQIFEGLLQGLVYECQAAGDFYTAEEVLAAMRASVARTAPQQYALVCRETGTTGMEALSHMAADFHDALILIPAHLPAVRMPLEQALEWIRDQAIEA